MAELRKGRVRFKKRAQTRFVTASQLADFAARGMGEDRTATADLRAERSRAGIAEHRRHARNVSRFR